MTNYNDGKWHGWNGGECPVHPKSTVEVRYSANFGNDHVRDTILAGISDCWNHDRPAYQKPNNIVAFRVVKEHREPREFWVDPERCIATSAYHAGFVHVREVLE